MSKDMFVQELAIALVKLNIMSDQEVQSLVQEFNGRSKGRIDDFLLEEGIVDREMLLKALQQVYNIPAADVRGYFFNHHILLLFPRDFLMNKAMIPMQIDEDDIITVVMSDPLDEEAVSMLADSVPYNVNVMVGIRRDIIDAIEEYYDEDVATSDINEQDNDIEENDAVNESDDVDIF